MQTSFTPQPPSPPSPVVVSPGASSSAAVYKAYREQRSELADQLETLEEKRSELMAEVNQAPTGSLKSGLEARIAEVDKRIAAMDGQLAAADAQVATAAAVPGAIVEPPRFQRSGPPEEVFVLGGMFIVVVMLPLSIALARRIWKRGTVAVSAFPQEMAERFSRLEQSVDSIAIEVERIGEGQRFVTRALSESGDRVRVSREGERGVL